MLRVGLVLLAALAAAAEPAVPWSYRPLVAYEDEAVVAVLPGLGWRSEQAATSEADGQTTIRATPAALSEVSATAADGRRASLRFIHPGQGRELAVGNDGLPTVGGVAAVLVLSRLEARADRRWALLRERIDDTPAPCATRLPPPDISQGRPALIAQCVAAQAVDPRGGVLVELSALDRVAGWKHREYRQVLAWLVCDLQARAAGHVALAGPCGPAVYANDLAPFSAQVRDVADAYRCRVVDTAGLDAATYWELQPGVLGTAFNAAGIAARAARFAPWLTAR